MLIWFSVQVYPSTQRRSLGCNPCRMKPNTLRLLHPAFPSLSPILPLPRTSCICVAPPLSQGYLSVCLCILNISALLSPNSLRLTQKSFKGSSWPLRIPPSLHLRFCLSIPRPKLDGLPSKPSQHLGNTSPRRARGVIDTF
jgi:hypothetical protein